VEGRTEHWEQVYTTRATSEVSWYQREPGTSIRLIKKIASGTDDAVIDVGGGASFLVDRLLAHGFTDVTVLDISEHVLEEVRRRLGPLADSVELIAQDLLTWEPPRHYDVWHDRAVFHFLTQPQERRRYLAVAARALEAGSNLILGTFAEDGPTQCSGLPVARYSALDLRDAFAASFALVMHEREEHVTPSGGTQPFTWVVLRRT
jgi:SAM-dependent methyltransferase